MAQRHEQTRRILTNIRFIFLFFLSSKGFLSIISSFFFNTVIIFFFLDEMYCIQWLLPLFLLPHPILPSIHHYFFLVLHLLNFLLEKRPCTICLLVFCAASILFCYNRWEQCIFWPQCSLR